jgi:gluconolactonase
VLIRLIRAIRVPFFTEVTSMSYYRLSYFFVAVMFTTVLPVRPQGSIPGIGPVGGVTRAQMGFQFTEGPAADAEGNVYFTDVQRNRIHRIDTQGQLSTFLDGSQGCNGLMFDGRGRLIACQGGAGRIIAIDVSTKDITVVADQYQGRRFDRPNDLVIDQQGGVYFTDPVFGGTPIQDKQGVYYVAVRVHDIVDSKGSRHRRLLN